MAVKSPGAFRRRGFLGAALIGAGAGLGWVARQFQKRPATPEPQAPLDPGFRYDVSEFETTDPALLRYQPAAQFQTGLQRVQRLAVLPGDGFMVAGDRGIRFFDAQGRPGREISLDRPPHCLQPTGPDEVLVGLADAFAAYDLDGKEKMRSPRFGGQTFLTALAAREDTLYLADAGHREVLICHRRTGAVMDRFGKKNRVNPGFAVPSPYFDLALAGDGRLRIANPGRLRVETYTLDGRFESAWGQPGLQIDRFCGCCNPVYFTLRPDGSYITSEKGLARVNLYDAHGKFQGAVAGPETLVDDRELAKRACADCRVGAGFDVAVDSRGRVLVLDPFRKVVRTFVPKALT